MTLGELIYVLERANPAKKVPHGFRNPHSYRGYYEQLAFEPCGETTVGEMLKAAKGALGQTFQGYKGGDFRMDQHTDVWIARYGECGDGMSHMLMCYMLGTVKQKCFRCDGTGEMVIPCNVCGGKRELDVFRKGAYDFPIEGT